MGCERIQLQLVHYLYGERGPPQALEVMGHLERCVAGRCEFTRLQRVYQPLNLWEDIAPSPELSPLFYAGQDVLTAIREVDPVEGDE